MDAVFVLFVVIFAFGGIAAAFAWSAAQDRRQCKELEFHIIADPNDVAICTAKLTNLPK